jgi:hypothetical protein
MGSAVIIILSIFAFIVALPASAKVYHSSSLGWKPGADVAKSLAGLLTSKKLTAGDELVLEHRYQMWGGVKLPDNFTISARKSAGFDVIDGGKPRSGRALFELGQKNTLRNLTLTYLHAPALGPTGEKMGVNYTHRLGIYAKGKSDVLIENCRLTGSINHHLKLVDCHRPKIIGCHIAGGHWTVLLSGDVKDPIIRRCLIEKCQGDAIKTGSGGVKGVRGALVENCVFQDNLRDGIDTTGGWKDAVVRNCIFRRLREGLDIKAFYNQKTDVSPEMSCSNIRIENCQFYDMPNGITLTTIDGGRRRGPGQELITAANVKDLAPHDIDIINCTFGHVETPLRPRKQRGFGVDYPKKGEHMRMLLLKDAHSIRYRDIRFLGERIRPYHIGSIGGSKDLSKEAARALNRTVSGNILPAPAPLIQPGITKPPFVVGPR